MGYRILFGWDVLRPRGLEVVVEDCMIFSFGRDGGVCCGILFGWDVLRPGGLEAEDCMNFSFGRDGSMGCRMFFSWGGHM